MDNNYIYQGLIKTKNKKTDYKDSEAKQGSSDSYRVITWSITKCNENKWHFIFTGDDEMIQQIIPINKSVPQDILVIWRK